MKIALLFIINYNHILLKEELWKQWIEPNKDIINVYFYYKDINLIKSQWIRERCIPSTLIYPTSYYYVIPAYYSLMYYSYNHNKENTWFCFLTDSCCPIISPEKFAELFTTNYNKSIFSYKPAYWNPNFHKRANLAKIPRKYWLAQDPWFIATKKHIELFLLFPKVERKLMNVIISGGLANETLFAVILKYFNQLNNETLINNSSHITDWRRMSSKTSPYVFKTVNEYDINFIKNSLKNNNYAVFLRKLDASFPDTNIKNIWFSGNNSS